MGGRGVTVDEMISAIFSTYSTIVIDRCCTSAEVADAEAERDEIVAWIEAHREDAYRG
jgi:hypothetical protein